MSTPKYNTIQCKGSSESSLRNLNELFIQANFNKYYHSEEGEYIANILNDLRDVKKAVAALTNEFNKNSIALNLSVASGIPSVPDASATPSAPTGNIFVSSSVSHPEDYNNITRIICPTMPDTLASQDQFNSDAHDFLFTENRAKFKKTIADNIDGLVKLAKLLDGGVTSKFDINMNKLKVIFANDATVTELISLIEEEKNVLSAFWSGASMWHRAIVEFTSESLTGGENFGLTQADNRIYSRELLSLVLYMRNCTVDLSKELMFYAFEKYSALFLEYLKTIPVFMTGGSRNSEYVIFNNNKGDKAKFNVLFENFIKNPGNIGSVSDHLDVIQRIKILGVIAGIYTAFGEPLESTNSAVNSSTFDDWLLKQFSITPTDSEIVTKVKGYRSSSSATPPASLVAFTPVSIVSFDKLSYLNYSYSNVFSIGTSTSGVFNAIAGASLSGSIAFDAPVTKTVYGSVHTFTPVSGTVNATIPTTTGSTTVSLTGTVSLVIRLDSIFIAGVSFGYTAMTSMTVGGTAVPGAATSGTINFRGPISFTYNAPNFVFSSASGTVYATISLTTGMTTTVALSGSNTLVFEGTDDLVSTSINYSSVASVVTTPSIAGTPLLSGVITIQDFVSETVGGTSHTFTSSTNFDVAIPTGVIPITGNVGSLSINVSTVVLNANVVTYSNIASITTTPALVGSFSPSGTITFSGPVVQSGTASSYTYVAFTGTVTATISGISGTVNLTTTSGLTVNTKSGTISNTATAILINPVFASSEDGSRMRFASLSCSNFVTTDTSASGVRTLTITTGTFTTTDRMANFNGSDSNFVLNPSSANTFGIDLSNVVIKYTSPDRKYNIMNTTHHPVEINSGTVAMTGTATKFNFTNVLESFVNTELDRLTETLPFNTTFAKVCLFGCHLVVDMLANETPDYATGEPTKQLSKLCDLMNATFGVNDYVPLSVTKPGTSRNWFNSELEDYIHVALLGQFLISGKFARIFTEMQFGILDVNAFNFIPLTRGGFVEVDSDVTLVLPSMNSRVRVHNTGSKTIKVRVLYCRNDTLHTSHHLQTVSAGEDCNVYAYK